MNKKYFDELAAYIANTIVGHDARQQAAEMICYIVSRDNPHFDKDRFLKACRLL